MKSLLTLATVAIALGGMAVAQQAGSTAEADAASGERHHQEALEARQDATPEGDASSGQQLAQQQCSACHGTEGVAQQPDAPNIGGQPAWYLATQLANFRAGMRQNEQMSVIAADLSDQDIADLAAWYGSQTVTLAGEPGDTSGAPEACTVCHGADGMSNIPGVPYLAGHSEMYLAAQLKAFRGRERLNAAMNSYAGDLSDEDIKQYAAYYARIGVDIGGDAQSQQGASPQQN